MRQLVLAVVVVCGAVLETVSCANIKRAPQFNQGHRVATVTSGSIGETSGICASRLHSNVLFVHNDSGDTHRIFAIDSNTGHRLSTITIDGAQAQDWEDIACGPCPGGSGHCIYIADTGGNAGGDANTIYRIREPAHVHNDQHVPLDSALKFSWDQHNCETVMVDPHGEVYVISKVSPGQHGKLVHLPSSLWGGQHHQWVSDGVYISVTASSEGPVAADISPNGKEVLVKTYGHVYYYSVPDGNYAVHLKGHADALPYPGERQGEAVCWESNGSGFYTLSEGYNQPLYYYSRASPGPVG